MPNKNQVKGTARKGTGKVKETAGKAMGDRKLESKGRSEQATGKAESFMGDMKEKAKDLIDKVG